MFKELQTLKQRKAIKFASELIKEYGYTLYMPAEELATKLRERGQNICGHTIRTHLAELLKLGVAKKMMTARKNGATYKFNRYYFQRYVSEQRTEKSDE